MHIGSIVKLVRDREPHIERYPHIRGGRNGAPPGTLLVNRAVDVTISHVRLYS